MRALAISVALLLTTAPAAAQVTESDWPANELVADLASDSERFNGLRAYRSLYHRAWHSAENAEEIRRLLEPELEADDRQLRQAASLLLEAIYKRHGVPEAEWPDALFGHLVDALLDDDIYGGRLVSNAENALQALYELDSRRPVEGLRSHLRSDDYQARFAAASVLARYLNGVEPEVSDILLEHLRDDRGVMNEMAAFRGLVELGEANLRHVLDRVEPEDWQQAGLLQCAAACLGVEWRAPERFVGEWIERAESAPRSKIAPAALYLHPDVGRIAQDREIPELLERLLRLGPQSRGVEERARWAAGWFWFLDFNRQGWWSPRYALGFF